MNRRVAFLSIGQQSFYRCQVNRNSCLLKVGRYTDVQAPGTIGFYKNETLHVALHFAYPHKSTMHGEQTDFVVECSRPFREIVTSRGPRWPLRHLVTLTTRNLRACSISQCNISHMRARTIRNISLLYVEKTS